MITKNPWNDECELCYGKHKFKIGEWMFQIEHEWSPEEPIIVCQNCVIRNPTAKVLDKRIFPVLEEQIRLMQ